MKKESVTHLTGEGNYAWLHYSDGRKHITAQTLKHLESVLPEYIRIHKSFLVNPAYIRKVKPFPHTLSGVVILVNGTELPVSRRRWPQVEDRLSRIRKGP
ncbi:LytR/AlgR family response regulator transcription factor [Tellurirhabdus bombi]|uniref:LytR/AlgR family response regulator transcription factor n=1 Tax=Tellurirhabdus bombi TaxID=2907205 RepID=UPI001F200958|nr:LytTR family DNA-binding domain-containing protein [Tellurirhabdus bombi]